MSKRITDSIPATSQSATDLPKCKVLPEDLQNDNELGSNQVQSASRVDFTAGGPMAF